jgi:hypothetical protein
VDEVFFFGQQILCMTTVSLPAVGRFAFSGAGDGESASTVWTKAATRDVVDQHAIALFEMATSLPQGDNLSTGFMSIDNPLVQGLIRSGGRCAMLMVNVMHIAPANPGGFHLD